jgi:preprotein translocase subunit SecD
VVERELHDALVALREPTRGGAPAPLEPIADRAAGRRRRARLVQVAAVVLAVLVIGAGVVRLAGRSAGGIDVQTQGPGLRFGAQGSVTPEDLDRTASIVHARLAAMGDGDTQVSVEDGAVVVRGIAPGPVLSLALARTVVEFRPVVENLPPLPPGENPVPTSDVEWLPDIAGVESFEVGPSALDGSAVESASAALVPPGRWAVLPVLRPGPDGVDRFNALAARCYAGEEACLRKRIAVVMDGKVLLAPTIQAPAYERDAIEISGDLTEQHARELAALLNLGNLPVTLVPR